MNSKKGRWLLPVLGLALACVGCFKPIIPIRFHDDYPIDVFYENQPPDRPYTEIQLLSLSEEVPLTDRAKRSRTRMLDRGIDQQEKEVIVARLVVQAQKLGADALVNIKYRVFSSENSSGYIMEGLAVKYRGE